MTEGGRARQAGRRAGGQGGGGGRAGREDRWTGGRPGGRTDGDKRQTVVHSFWWAQCPATDPHISGCTSRRGGDAKKHSPPDHHAACRYSNTVATAN